MAEKHIGQTNGAFTVHDPCGRLTLCLETFFPVTQKKARQLFRLMKENSEETEVQELLAYLHGRAERLPPESARTAERCRKNAAFSRRGGRMRQIYIMKKAGGIHEAIDRSTTGKHQGDAA